MKYFTHYWKNSTWDDNRQANFSEYAVKHISGNDLSKCGISVGDTVFIITVKEGRLFVSGKLIVGKFCNREDAAKEMNCKTSDIWDAREHIIASSYTTTTLTHWNLEVPLEITKQLRFISGSEIKSPFFTTKTELDKQTLRKPRQLTFESAKKLDEVLASVGKIEFLENKLESNWEDVSEFISDETKFESAVEGNKTQRFTTKYERDSSLRKQAIQIHGYTCKVCEINFEKSYGEHGKDFIHVHHLKPLFQFETPKAVTPKTDMTVLCPNCHSMIHRKKSKTLTIEQLKAVYKK